MITHAEATIKFEQLIRKSQSFIEDTGFLYPYIVLLKKGAPLQIKYTHPTIINIDTEDDIGDSNKVYATLVACKSTSKEDEEGLKDIAAKLTRIASPDAVGVALVVFFKEVERKIYKKALKNYQASTDPDAVKGLYACYYLRDEDRAVVKLVPFLDRGAIKSDLPEALNDEDGEVTRKRDLHFVEAPWFPRDEKVDGYIPNPYL
jgi:hypothetical protein